MPRRDPLPPELHSARLGRLTNVRRLKADRSGHASTEHARHQLYVARDKESRAEVLLKVTTKPGLVYEQALASEIDTIGRLNGELPDSPYFPLLIDHGRLGDSRMFLIMSLFPEWPLATTIGPERRPDRLVAHLRTALAVGTALADAHRIGIFHVDLNPMNILYRSEQGRPVVRIVDFESAYDVTRHAKGVFYNPPTTSGFTAPEVPGHAPDARADVFSLAAVLYTMIAGYEWASDAEDLTARISADTEMDADLAAILLTSADRDRHRRYPSMRDLSAALSAYLESIWPGRSQSA